MDWIIRIYKKHWPVLTAQETIASSYRTWTHQVHSKWSGSNSLALRHLPQECVLAGLILGSLLKKKKEKEEDSGGNCSSCDILLGFGEHILDFSHSFFFMMVQLEFLQGEHVNHHGNFRGQGGKKLALDIFLCSGGCGTQMNSSSHPSAAHPSPPNPPHPKSSQSNPFENSWCSSLQGVFP